MSADNARETELNYEEDDNHVDSSEGKETSENNNTANSDDEKNVYVSQLPTKVEVEELRALFAPFGEITTISVIKDPSTNLSRGFGFIHYKNAADRHKAIEALHNTTLHDRILRVEESKRKGSYEKTPGQYKGTYKRLDNNRPYSRGGDYDRGRDDYRPRDDHRRDDYRRDDYRGGGDDYRSRGYDNRGGDYRGAAPAPRYDSRDGGRDYRPAAPAYGGGYAGQPIHAPRDRSRSRDRAPYRGDDRRDDRRGGGGVPPRRDDNGYGGSARPAPVSDYRGGGGSFDRYDPRAPRGDRY